MKKKSRKTHGNPTKNYRRKKTQKKLRKPKAEKKIRKNRRKKRLMGRPVLENREGRGFAHQHENHHSER
jgi:hypothetical protein